MTPGILSMTPKQIDRVLKGLMRHFLGRLNQNPVVLRLSRRSAQRIRTRGKNSKCRIQYKSNGSPPEAHSGGSSTCVLFSIFFLHNNAPAHNAAVIYQFLTRKILQPFIKTHTLQIYLRQTIFCSPSLKWNWKDSTLLRSKKLYQMN
jgi:hypothetical protein